MERIRLEDLLEDCYRDEGIRIAKVKGVDIYFLRRFSGRIADDIYLLKKDEVEKLLDKKVGVEELINDIRKLLGTYNYF